MIVFAPRARDDQRALIRLAREMTGGPIIVDGAKTDGIDALYRELRGRAEVEVGVLLDAQPQAAHEMIGKIGSAPSTPTRRWSSPP